MIVWHHQADLDLAVVRNGRLSIDWRQADLPDTKRISLHFMAVSVPTIEVSDQIGAHSKWSPLSVRDGLVGRDGEAIFLVAS